MLKLILIYEINLIFLHIFFFCKDLVETCILVPFVLITCVIYLDYASAIGDVPRK